MLENTSILIDALKIVPIRKFLSLNNLKLIKGDLHSISQTIKNASAHAEKPASHEIQAIFGNTNYEKNIYLPFNYCIYLYSGECKTDKKDIGSASELDVLYNRESLLLTTKEEVSNKINCLISTITLYKATGGKNLYETAANI